MRKWRRNPAAKIIERVCEEASGSAMGIRDGAGGNPVLEPGEISLAPLVQPWVSNLALAASLVVWRKNADQSSDSSHTLTNAEPRNMRTVPAWGEVADEPGTGARSGRNGNCRETFRGSCDGRRRSN